MHEFTRGALEALIRPVVDRTMASGETGAGRRAIEAQARFDEVVLVGGTTRTPLIRRTVQEFFDRKPHTELNPDEVVALGAAVQANILDHGVKNMLLLDVTPLSLGIETYGGAVAKIIPRNSTIPASAQELYTTGVDNQTGIDIHVLQGERELAKDCRSLARFTLRVPPAPAGLPRIEVKFLIDANGILQVAAKDIAHRRAAHHRSAAELRPERCGHRAHAGGIHRVCGAGFCRAPGDRSAHRSGIDSDGHGESAGESARRRNLPAPERAKIDAAYRGAARSGEGQLTTS